AQAERERSGLSTTVFLDEVAELSVACQNALLKVLVDANGQGRAQRLGARMISSNSRNLEAEIRQERFREDLFYHLNGICLRVPPLRHRQEDIPCLLEFFLKKYAEALSREPVALQEKTMRALRGYSWPGNVRELEELAKKIVVSGEGVALAGLNANSSGSGPAESLSTMLSLKVAARNASRQVERELILKTLERTRWNRKRAARDLGISYKALLYKLKQIALDDATAT
ncbi:MAG TPA: helix-turn-helix domain-containing protein, partial [Candidatus Dormibacteraeota bacterium]|nr:helix-turn-helix domain-containing protein [Candidatus Dormibacteraeota bacterium]